MPTLDNRKNVYFINAYQIGRQINQFLFNLINVNNSTFIYISIPL